MDWIKITILQSVFPGKIVKVFFLGIEVTDNVIGKGTHNILFNAPISPVFDRMVLIVDYQFLLKLASFRLSTQGQPFYLRSF